MMTPMNALYNHVRAHPNDTAFTYGEVAWTYYDLIMSTERLARSFLRLGIQQGDRVVLHMPNLPDMAVAVYACFRIGAIAVPMNLRFKTPELRRMFQRLRPAIYIGEEQLYAYVDSIESELLPLDRRFISGVKETYAGIRPLQTLYEAVDEQPLPFQPRGNTPVLLLTTSGTTGEPKFVTHTAATLTATMETFLHWHLDEEQTALVAAPMVHGAGLFTFLACVYHGAPAVLVERFDPGVVLDRIETHGVTWLIGLPFMFHGLLAQQHMRPRRINALQFSLSGGDVCPVRLQEDF